MIAIIIVGAIIALIGGFTLAKPQSVLTKNERGSAKLGRAMGIADRQERDIRGQRGWAKAAGGIILVVGLVLVVVGFAAM